MSKKKVTILSVLLEILAVLNQISKMWSSAMVKPKIEDARFINLAGGWIKDVQTGLEWGPSSDKSMNWEEAKKFCADQGGRLSNVAELVSLVDRTKYSPATLIPGMKSEWYWTDEPVAWHSGGARGVDFDDGAVGAYGKGFDGYVRPVRSSQ